MEDEILAEAEFSGSIDVWTEYLCVRKLFDGRVEISSKSNEVLALYYNYDGMDVVWPDGYDPLADSDGSEGILPLMINGVKVFGVDGDAVIGESLAPHSDDSVIRLSKGQIKEARDWLEDYGWTRKDGFKDAWNRVVEFLS